jgi:hypothetical protein
MQSPKPAEQKTGGNQSWSGSFAERIKGKMKKLSEIILGILLIPCTFLLIYLLTPWSRVLLEKLTVKFAAGQEIPRICGTRKSLTVPTCARHLSLS